jgi:arginyl-tRNA synthetase
MIDAEKFLFNNVQGALKEIYSISTQNIVFQKTRKEFVGDFTLVTFVYTKDSNKTPEQLGAEIGDYLVKSNSFIEGYNVVKGFLNISLSTQFWINYFNEIKQNTTIGLKKENSSGKMIMLEYASPNTNKPLHLGHVRNNFLGYSVAQLLKANGHQVIKTNLVNDRGIHICKSMLAWQKFGNGETPKSSGLKGDHLVGKYYVAFDKLYKQQVEILITEGHSKELAEKKAPLLLEAQEMLLLWEAGNYEVLELWKTMNSWVYEGFDITYKNLGVDFDKIYYESDTYLLGKEVVEQGLSKNIFYKKDNGSVAIDLVAEGLDEKIVLRSDGTSVYITQDLGTAIERFKSYPQLNQLIYTVGNEQDYHFKVLFKILDRLGYQWAKECYHLSYGMVELPEGKMKSREGTVVDADELLEEMYETARLTTEELGKVEGFTEFELDNLYRTISLGALKYFILKVDPKKKMMFDPKESIDFNGHTGPFIQYTYTRIKSILRKSENLTDENFDSISIQSIEKEIIRFIYDFEAIIVEAGKSYSPALLANYIYEFTKLYNRFYHECPILKEENSQIRNFRLHLSKVSAQVLYNAMSILGITMPERM